MKTENAIEILTNLINKVSITKILFEYKRVLKK